MILEAMYNGEFYPCETVVPTSPEYGACDNAPGPNNTVLTNRHTGKKNCTATNPYTIFDRDRLGKGSEESCSFLFPVCD